METKYKSIGKKIKTESDLVCWVNEQRDRWLNGQSIVLQQWLNTLAAFHNRPDLVTTDDLRLINRIGKPSPAEEKKMTDIAVNFVQPQIRTLAGKLQRGNPILECVPFSSDQSDVQAAQIGDKFLQSERHDQRIDQRRLEMAMWLGGTGNAFWHAYYDASAGEILEEGIPTGRLKTDCISPLKVCVEGGRSDIADCWWAIITERLPKYQLYDAYSEAYKKRTGEELHISSAKDSDVSGALQDGYLSVIGIMPQQQDYDDYADVHTLYHRPTKDYPGGIYAIVSGDKVLHVGKYPYEFIGRLPIFHFREILCPWRFYGDTGTYQTYLNQLTYHELRQLEKRFIRGNTNTKILVREGMKINRRGLKSADSEILEVSGARGENLQVIQPRGVPSSMYPSINLAREEIFQSSGIRESSMGAAAGNVNASGRALLALQEQDDVRLAFTVQQIELEMSAWGKTTLAMAKQYYNEPRKYSIAGKRGAGGLWYFNRADLINTTDVVCASGSAMPQNKYAKREFVLMMFDKGILGDPRGDEARMLARKMLEFGNYEEVTDDTAADSFVADQENIWMESSGQLMSIAEIDNHAVHIKDHRIYALSPGIRDNPEKLAVFTEHLRMHVQAMNPQMSQTPSVPGGQPAAMQQEFVQSQEELTAGDARAAGSVPVQSSLTQEPALPME